MPTPPDSGEPHDGPALEPIRVLRPRRTDALAALVKEFQESRHGSRTPQRSPGTYGSVTPPAPEPQTEHLPSVPDGGAGREWLHSGPAGHGYGGGTSGRGKGGGGSDRANDDVAADRGRVPRRTVVAVAVTAAAVLGFGSALLLTGGNADMAQAADPPAASAMPTAAPSPAAPGAADPDGAGTLREGDSGPEVADLQERLLRIPDVYTHGSTGGHYDATLTAAVARFQLWYGIRGDETGVYGNDTRQALESRTKPSTG